MNDRSRRYFVGLSLGGVQEYTGLAVLERPVVTAHEPPHRRRPAFDLRHLERFVPGTPYADVFERLRRLLQAEPLPGCILLIDQTGVGRAVVQMLVEHLTDRVTCHLSRFTLTAGHEGGAGARSGLHLPKQELVGTIQVLLQTRRLRVAASLPEAAALLRELQEFRAQVARARGEEELDWRQRPHDDLVLAVALAAWLAEETLPRLDEEPDTRPMWLYT